jgi:hypothetical protein
MKQAAGALLSSIRMDRSVNRRVSVQLYTALRDIILSGGLRAGDRLPATRFLAKEVGLSRTTVIDAIDRLALDAFPMAHWARLSARHLRGDRETVMGYGDPKGFAPLHRAIAARLSALKGIQCAPYQVFASSGAQQVFALIGTLCLNSGDKVWIENPGALGVRNALLSSGGLWCPSMSTKTESWSRTGWPRRPSSGWPLSRRHISNPWGPRCRCRAGLNCLWRRTGHRR